MMKTAFAILALGLVGLSGCQTNTSIGALADGATSGAGDAGSAAGDSGPGAGDAPDGPTGCGAAGTIAWQARGDYVVNAKSISFALAVGDLDGDGKPDLAVGGDGIASVMLNRGDGSFAAPVAYATRANPRIAIGDVNGDGKADLAVTGYYPGGVDVLVNQGGGTLAPAVTYAGVMNGTSIALGDLNGDGKTDIAVTDDASVANLVILTNTGGGTFSASSFPVLQSPNGLAAADVSRDGRIDIAVSSIGNGLGVGGVSLYLNDRSGGFAAPAMYASSLRPSGVALGDLNGDGKLDILTATADANVLLNYGDDTFAVPVVYSLGHLGIQPDATNPASLAIGDLNGDGKPDIAFASLGAGAGALFNQGGGSFGALTSLPVCSPTGPLALGDFDGDGKLDAAVITTTGVTVLLTAAR
jgi:hypothetical protein